MNIEEFNRWKKIFKGDVDKFYDNYRTLVDLFNTVFFQFTDVYYHCGKLGSEGHFLCDHGHLFCRGVKKIRDELRSDSRESSYLQNMIWATRPNFQSFLSFYEPARKSYATLRNDITRFNRFVRCLSPCARRRENKCSEFLKFETLSVSQYL